MLHKKILITGGAGFIGYHLTTHLLKKNYLVKAIDKFPIYHQKNNLKNLKKYKNFSYSQIDLKFRIRKKFYNLSHVFHLAASLGVKNINKNPYDSFKNNINSLLNLIDNLKNYSPNSTLIYFSSSEVYSPLILRKKIKLPAREDVDLLINKGTIKRDSYYLSKLIGEKIVPLSWLKYTILRHHNIYGPRMGFRHVISELIRKMWMSNNIKYKKYEIFSPYHTRSFCYIDDAIDQIVKISFNKKSHNEIFNIGNSKGEIKIFKLAKLIKKTLKSNVILTGGPITPGSPPRRVPDIKKTLKLTKLKKLVKLEEGIKRTIKWFIETN